MPLAAGTQLDQYEIVALLGAGGMGEVYRAKDTRLGRDVALKTLPDSVTGDPERLARFRREAQVLASLNHQHIAGIYGFEETNGHRFLVLELVDGETLASRIQRGAIPLNEALTIAREIADALEAAHEQGIVHRDLKPANIALTSSDRVKVLDFGLAKIADPTAGDPIISLNSPTITSPTLLTQVGMILGTAAYMSPEQAKGRGADKRSDVWAFGCVLFEMLTGRRAFEGDDVSDTLAAVLRGDPPWNALPSTVPASIRALLKGCLEKNPRERISDMSTAVFVLKHDVSSPLDVLTQSPRWLRSWPLTALVAAAAALGAAAAAVWLRSPPPNAQIAHFVVPMTDGRELSLGRRAVTVSPDGSHLAYTADGRIYIRPIAEADARPLGGADPGMLPTFSPDSRSIVFWANAELKHISISGGVPVTVCAAPIAPFALVWDRTGIMFEQRDRGTTGIRRVSPDGGTPQTLVQVSDKDGLVQKMQLLPDGDTVLFSLPRTEGWGLGDTFVQSIRTGERKRVLEGGVDAQYLPSGRIVYLVGSALMMRSFDVRRKEVTGGAVPLIDGIRRSGGANYSISDTGVLAYIPGAAKAGQDRVIVYDRKDTVTALPLPAGLYQHPRISPDGKWLAIETYDGNETAISLYELGSANSMSRLTYGGNNGVPVWSADGTHIAFQSDREGDRAIWWQSVNGGPAERLTRPERGEIHTPESWAPHGDVLLFSATKETETTLWAFSISSRKALRFSDVKSTGGPTNAVFSPDGDWVAYSSADVSLAEGWTYIEPFPPTGTKHRIARGGRPAWSRTGKELELFFVPAPGQFAAVTIRTRPMFGFTNPISVPRRFSIAFPGNPRPYDPLPDGRFVTVGSTTGPGAQPPPEIHVVLNWFEELERQAPAQ